LTAVLQQVQSTLRELDLSVDLYSKEVNDLDICPVSSQLGPLRGFSCLRKLKAPIVTLVLGDKLLQLAEVVPTGLTHLSLTEDLVSLYLYEWNEESVLEELAVLLSVWRSATPDLQVVEVWLSRVYNRWKDEDVTQLQMMFEEAGLLCIVKWRLKPSYSSITFQWVRQGPAPSERKVGSCRFLEPLAYPV
jgi:hypothetical protein